MPFKEKKQKDDVYIPRRIAEKKQKDDVYIPAPKVVAVPTPAVNNNLRDPIRPTGPYFSPAQLAGWAAEAANPQRQEQVFDSSAGRALPYTGLAASVTQIPPTSPGVYNDFRALPPPFPGPQLPAPLGPPAPPGGGIRPNVFNSPYGTTLLGMGGNAPTSRPLSAPRPLPATPTPQGTTLAAKDALYAQRLTAAQQAAAGRAAQGQSPQQGVTRKEEMQGLLNAGLRKGDPKIDPKTGVMSRGVLLEAARYTAAAMFQYHKLPNKMTLRLAQELPFGTLGYASAEEMLMGLGYYFDPVSGWWVLGAEGAAAGEGGTGEGEGEVAGDSGGGGGYGDYGGGGGWDDVGWGRVFQPSPSISRGSTFAAAGGGLVNWRIG